MSGMHGDEAKRNFNYLNFEREFNSQELLNSSKWLHGESIFTSFLAKNGKTVALALHLERLRKNLKFVYSVEIDKNFSLKLQNFLKKNIPSDGNYHVRIEFFRKSTRLKVVHLLDLSHLITIKTFEPKSLNDVAVDLFDEAQMLLQNQISHIKNSNYFLSNFLKDKNGSDYLVSDQNHKILEASTSAVAVVKNNCLLFPRQSYQLESITKQVLLDNLDIEKVNFSVLDLSLDDFKQAQEIILLNSLRGIIPVQRIGALKLDFWKKNSSITFRLNTIYQSLFEKL